MSEARIVLSLLPPTAMLRRELLSNLRRTRTFVLIGGVCTLFIGVFIYSISLVVAAQGAGYSPERMIVSLSGWFSVLTMVLIPPLTIFAIREEKQQDTLDLLMMSLIRPSVILLSKIAGMGLFYLLTVIALLPVIGVAFFFVGLDITQFASLFGGLLLIALLTAAIAAYCAVSLESAPKAILSTYLLLFFITTFTSCLSIFQTGFVAAAPPFYTGYFVRHIPQLATLAFIVALAVETVRNFRKFTAPPPPPGERPIDDKRVLRERRLSYPFYLIDPRRRKPPIRDGRNPVHCRELITSPFSQADLRIRMALIYTLISLPVAIYMLGRGHDSVDTGLVITLHSYFLTFLCPAFAATLMVKEHEQDNLDMLRMTLLSPAEVIRGKMRAGVSFMYPLLVAPVLAIALFFPYQPDRWSWLFNAILHFCGLINFTCFLVALTLASTLPLRQTAMALLTAFTVPLLVVFLLPFLAMVLFLGEVTSGYMAWEALLALIWPSPYLSHEIIAALQRDHPSIDHVGNSPSRVLFEWPHLPEMLWFLQQLALLFWTWLLIKACRGHYEKKLLRDE
jgi:hypothetical protein